MSVDAGLKQMILGDCLKLVVLEVCSCFLSGLIEINAQIKGEPAAKIDRGNLCCDILR